MNLLPSYEIWNWVPGYEGWYEVSNRGQVRTWIRFRSGYKGGDIRLFLFTPKIIKQTIVRAGKGYWSVSLYKKRLFTHRLVCLAFIPNPFGLSEVNHKNGDTLCCTLWNVEWASHYANMNHAFRTSLIYPVLGEKQSSSKITKENAIFIYQSELRSGLLAEKFKIHTNTIRAIKRGLTWSHATGAVRQVIHKGKYKRIKYGCNTFFNGTSVLQLSTSPSCMELETDRGRLQSFHT